jgi:predicted metal-binding membrane protein
MYDDVVLTKLLRQDRAIVIAGMRDGAYCLGCCWLLMAVLFAVGVMNLAWIMALSVFVLLEKVIPRGLVVARTAGVLLMSCGGWLALSGGA